ncbi:MAG: hypothetical protein IJR13_00855 [Bacteroidales bacterium]|nr:hypothetical protein [Bacteroidales bacterium]
MKKGIDSSFIHYGIRREDLDTIAQICQRHEVDFEWLKEDLLRPYHARRAESIEMSNEETEEIIEAAVMKIRQG